MAYGKIKADAFIYDDGGSDTEITTATIASNSNKAPTASPTFTGTVTLPATTALAGQASDVTIIDNNAAALEVKEGSNTYVTFDTTNSAEQIEVAKPVVASDNIILNAQKELRLADSDSSNHIALKAPATVASNVTLTLPDDDGDADQYLQTNGSGVLSWATVSASTGNDYAFASNQGGTAMSGSTVTITNIPSNATKIDIMFNNVSYSANTDWSMRLGTSAGLKTTGYDSHAWYFGYNTVGAAYTNRFNMVHNWASASFVYIGNVHLNKSDDDQWHGWWEFWETTTNNYRQGGMGYIDLAATLDRIAFFPDSGSFDNGYYTLNVYTE